MPSLFELDDQLKAAIVKMEDNITLGTGEIPEKLVDEYMQLDGEMRDKLGAWGRWFKNERALAEAARAEARTQTANARAAESKMEFIRTIIGNRLEQYVPKDEAGGKLFDGVVRLSWLQTHKVVGFDEETCEGLPEEFIKITKEPRKKLITKHIKEKGPVEWAYIKSEKVVVIK